MPAILCVFTILCKEPGAWPPMFQQGPEAMPAGNNYDNIEYGLFEPFLLKNSRTSKKQKN